MEKELFDYVAERADVLAVAGSAKQETKDAAIAWKEAVAAEGADVEAATLQFVDFLEGRPSSIDGVIAFAQGPAIQMFGQEVADQILSSNLARKEQGAKFCGCEACTAASEILAKFGRVEL